MRKYEYLKNSSFLDRNLKGMSWGQKRWEDYAKNEFCPFMKLREKLFFYYQMMKMKKTLRLMRRGDHISSNDYLKLKDLWSKVFLRTYRTG